MIKKVIVAFGIICCITCVVIILGNGNPAGAEPDASSNVPIDSVENSLSLDVKANTNANLTSCRGEYTDILGFSGYYIDETRDGIWTIRRYYADQNGQSVKVAEIYGFELDEKSIDIDGDGTQELLCNCTTAADCHKELHVFKKTDSGIKAGYVNWLSLDMKGLFYWGCNAVSTEYDSASGNILIKYCDTGSNDTISTIQAGYNVIEYQDWDGDGFPFINQEEAYRRFGE